jgi:hypothetical protein
MEKHLWRQKYTNIPQLPCPRCEGKVRLDKTSLAERETAYSNRNRGGEDWTFYDVEERFICFLVCDVKWCGEIVAVSGFVSEQEEYVSGETDQEIDVFRYYHPMSMIPAPRPFPVSKKLDKDCQSDLLNAFRLLWNDHAACANRLRIFVEHLLDQLQVPRKIPGKRRNLDSRIEKFGEDHPEHAEILHALRHVGNTGSHTAKTKFEDVVDSLMLVEAIVKVLIDRDMDKILATARRLISKYGPPTK